VVAVNSYKYEVRAEGPYWVIHIPDLNLTTQARNLRETDRMAKSIIALHLEVDPETVDVYRSNIIGLPGNLAERVNKVVERRTWLAQEQEQIADETRWAATELIAAGVPLRDAGYLLGLSHQRVAQIADRVASIQAGIIDAKEGRIVRHGAGFWEQRLKELEGND
jgi:hypothetical protein